MRPQGRGEDLYVTVPAAFAGIERLGTEAACAIGCNAIGGIRTTDDITVCKGAIQVLGHVRRTKRAGETSGEHYFIAGGRLGIGKLAPLIAATASPDNSIAIGGAVT